MKYGYPFLMFIAAVGAEQFHLWASMVTCAVLAALAFDRVYRRGR